MNFLHIVYELKWAKWWGQGPAAATIVWLWRFKSGDVARSLSRKLSAVAVCGQLPATFGTHFKKSLRLLRGEERRGGAVSSVESPNWSVGKIVRPLCIHFLFLCTFSAYLCRLARVRLHRASSIRSNFILYYGFDWALFQIHIKTESTNIKFVSIHSISLSHYQNELRKLKTIFVIIA